jgi:hypothetical protein
MLRAWLEIWEKIKEIIIDEGQTVGQDISKKERKRCSVKYTRIGKANEETEMIKYCRSVKN